MKLPRIVYAIQHNVTKRIYVGSSANVENRYWNHMNNLRNHKHNIEDMQSDYDNYGEDYSLYLLDEIKVFSERNKEYEWMKKLNTHTRGNGYNYKDRVMVERKKKLPLKTGIPTVRKEESR